MKKIRKNGIALLLFVTSCLNIVSAYAMEEGTYIVPLIVTYANPQTGEIVDGGSNEALGTSMCQSVMQAEALVEQNKDMAYVTLGIGLSSNISNTEILVQKEAEVNEYEAVTLNETDTCIQNDDTCIHYRFAMKDLEMLISPILFVAPMGRDVQFFVQLDTQNAVEGTGNFLSEMREVTPEAEVANAAAEIDTQTDEQSDTQDIEEVELQEMNNDGQAETKENNKASTPMLILIVLALIGTAVLCIYVRKRKRNERETEYVQEN